MARGFAKPKRLERWYEGIPKDRRDWLFIAAKEFHIPPKDALEMPFWQERALIEGLNEYYAESTPDGEARGSRRPSWASDDYDPYDPRFPRASRGDVMASPEELMALGIQYSRE